MDRVAVFVDAGYLFACGSILVAGEKLPRGRVELAVPGAIKTLEEFAVRISGLPLLRTYWYDGTSIGPTLDHRRLAHTDNVKVRLGFVNQAGEQKGVDSLIVTDMIMLARNRAMSTAVLVTGDEDLRVGVQQAQEFGVRVHLVGIEPARKSQSTLLVQEADQVHELHRAEIDKMLAIRSTAPQPAVELEVDESVPLEQRVARSVLIALPEDQVKDLAASLRSGSIDIPRDVDRLLLKTMREALGRDLSPDERKSMRQAFKDELEHRFQEI